MADCEEAVQTEVSCGSRMVKSRTSILPDSTELRASSPSAIRDPQLTSFPYHTGTRAGAYSLVLWPKIPAEVFLRRAKRPQSLAELVSYRREPALPSHVRILGLDPGSIRTGYAVVETKGADVTYIVSGAIRAQGETFAERLQEIFLGVDQLTNEFRPDEVAIERVFMHRNADSALKLGQARGAALSATFCLRPRVYEYAPREVKQAVVGTGAAEKEQVQLMVKKLLNIAGPLGPDAADALAIALCHAYSRRLNSLTRLAAR